MEAIILAGGKAERLGDCGRAASEGARRRSRAAARGVPGRPSSQAAGVERVIVSCAAGQGDALRGGARVGSGAEIVAVGEPERLGRGAGSIRRPRARGESGRRLRPERRRADRRRPRRAARGPPRRTARRRRSTVAALPTSPFGVVDLADDDRRRTASASRPSSRTGRTAGVYVFDDEAIARLPGEAATTSRTTLPGARRGGQPATPTGTRASG